MADYKVEEVPVEELQEQASGVVEETVDTIEDEWKPDVVYNSRDYKPEEETTEEQPKAEEPKAIEEQPKAEEPKVIEEQPKAEEPKVIEDAEEIKKEVKSLLDKLYEEDAFFKKLVDVYSAGEKEDVTNFFKSQSIDYKQVSDLDILRMKVNEEYKDESPDVREEIFKDELLNKYGYDLEVGEYSPDVNEKVSQARLKREAESLRSEYSNKQMEFQVPNREGFIPESQLDELLAERYEQYSREQQDSWAKTVKADQTLKQFLERRTISVDLPDKVEFNYEDGGNDTKFYEEATIDENKFFELFTSEADGKRVIDMKKWLKTLNYVRNMQDYEHKIFNRGVDHGKGIVTKEKKNISDPSSQANPPALSAKEQMKQAIRSAKESTGFR